LFSASARAEPEPEGPAPASTQPAAVPDTRRATDTSDPNVTPPEWRTKYDEARAKLLTGEFAAAAVLFAELEATAANRADHAAAHAQRTLADEWTSRNLAFVRRQDLADRAMSSRALNHRSTDELVSLYTNSVVYGIGSALWLGVLADPRTPAAAILPGLALTAGSVGTVLALDSGRGFHYGVPQSIVSGMWIGFEHGLVWTTWHNSRPAREDLDTKAHATILWGLSTAGAVTGGILGEVLGTTPGRSAWVGSTTLWTGALSGFATGGLVEHGATTALAVAGIGLTAGTGIGLLSARAVSPPIGRVRLIDLSGLVGGLGAAALYAASASHEGTGRGASGVTSLGIAGGLAIGWVATSRMGRDALRTTEPKSEEPPAETESKHGVFQSIAARAHPLLLPQTSGAMLGAGGTF
jgi:hypothetical protein